MEQVLELKPSVKIRLVYGGKEYVLSKPKMSVALAMEEKIAAAKANKDGGMAVVADYLIGQGLPKELLDELDADQIQQIIEALTPAKKN